MFSLIFFSVTNKGHKNKARNRKNWVPSEYRQKPKRLSKNTISVSVQTKIQPYHKLKKSHKALSTWDVLAIREAFTVDKCRCIIWTIIDIGWAFFCQKMSVQDFSNPEGFTFPTSLLSSIKQEVWYTLVVVWPFYPQSWEIGHEPDKDSGTGKRKGTGGFAKNRE